MDGRLKVLVLAEAANPEWASVPLLGWSLAHALSEVADVHVVTQVRNRSAIERAGWREGAEFTAIDSEGVARPTYHLGQAIRKVTRLGWTATTAFETLPYYYFERLVWRRFGGAIRGHAFDVVHRITPLSPAIPSLIARHCQASGVPFVWGPVNGGVAWPREFASVRRQEGEWLSYVRDVHRLVPGYRSTRRDAAAILVGSRAAWEQTHGYHEKCVYIPENAVDPERFAARSSSPDAPPLRVAFVGRLVPYKGADMLLEAVAEDARAGRITVDVVGDGPERGALVKVIQAEGLSRAVKLHGWLKHQDVQRVLAKCHVLGFPSVREFGGGVVLEAMAMGVVPVVVDYAGPAELVTDDTGYRIPLGSRGEMVSRFRDVLGALARDGSCLRAMGERGHERVKALLTWKAKAHQIHEVYGWVAGRSPRPVRKCPFVEFRGPPRSRCSGCTERDPLPCGGMPRSDVDAKRRTAAPRGFECELP